MPEQRVLRALTQNSWRLYLVHIALWEIGGNIQSSGSTPSLQTAQPWWRRVCGLAVGRGCVWECGSFVLLWQSFLFEQTFKTEVWVYVGDSDFHLARDGTWLGAPVPWLRTSKTAVTPWGMNVKGICPHRGRSAVRLCCCIGNPFSFICLRPSPVLFPHFDRCGINLHFSGD